MLVTTISLNFDSGQERTTWVSSHLKVEHLQIIRVLVVCVYQCCACHICIEEFEGMNAESYRSC